MHHLGKTTRPGKGYQYRICMIFDLLFTTNGLLLARDTAYFRPKYLLTASILEWTCNFS